jgi:hypothetical protein
LFAGTTDLGDNYHILLAERMDEELIGPKYKYRTTTKPVVIIKLNMVKNQLMFGIPDEFGSPILPAKCIE